MQTRSERSAPLVYRGFGRDTWRDPFTLYRHLRDNDPVHLSPLGCWVLTRFEDVWEVGRDTTTFSSAQGLTFRDETEKLGLLPNIVMMDRPEHTRYRRLVSRRFIPREVERIEPVVREFVVERVEQLAGTPGADFVDVLARPLAATVVAHYLGVPSSDRHRFSDWTEAFVEANASGYAMGAGEALAELYGYFARLVDRKRSEPGDDLVSWLLEAEADGMGIGLEGILGYAFVMIAGGNDTMTGLLAGTAELLTAFRDQRRRLIDDPSLIPNAVDECLRLTSPVQGLCRVTTRRVRIDGTELPRGARVLLCYGAANRDPREFGPDVDELDVSRRIDRSLAFGTGPHHCIGNAIARVQARVVIEELLRRCPDFSVDADAGTFADGMFTRRYATLPFFPASG